MRSLTLDDLPSQLFHFKVFHEFRFPELIYLDISIESEDIDSDISFGVSDYLEDVQRVSSSDDSNAGNDVEFSRLRSTRSDDDSSLQDSEESRLVRSLFLLQISVMVNGLFRCNIPYNFLTRNCYTWWRKRCPCWSIWYSAEIVFTEVAFWNSFAVIYQI